MSSGVSFMGKFIALGILIFVLVVVVLALRLPNTFRVSRSININANSEKIFPLINDFQNWPKWSPYQKLDPMMQQTISPNSSGVGAIMKWDGNNKAGSGLIEIQKSEPNSLIAMRLEMLKPFSAVNEVEFNLKTEDSTTTVTWSMQGSMNFMSKLMDLFVGMDKLVGGQFSEGLENLKILGEVKAVTK
jgi:hypothetical protein